MDLPQTDQMSLRDLLLLPRASVLFFSALGPPHPKRRLWIKQTKEP